MSEYCQPASNGDRSGGTMPLAAATAIGTVFGTVDCAKAPVLPNLLSSKQLRTIRLAKRRGGDSNPRYGYPYTGFRNQLLQPLGHLSNTILT